MNLFYHPGACSLAVHIALAETGLAYQLVSISRDKRTSDGRDFLKINPKGFVPALELDDGRVLAEALAVLVYVAQRAGELLPEEDFKSVKHGPPQTMPPHPRPREPEAVDQRLLQRDILGQPRYGRGGMLRHDRHGAAAAVGALSREHLVEHHA